VSSIAVQGDGKIVIGGAFTSVNGSVRNHIARLLSDGSLDTTFITGSDFGIRVVALQPDGKILLGGDFTLYSGTARNRVARLNSSGILDTGFNPGSGTESTVWTLALQTDGRILLGGDFTTYNGTGCNYVARTTSTGSLDTTFNPGTGANNSVYALAVQTDGKIIIGGAFTSYNGTTRNRIARLGANGTIDTTFNPGSGPNGAVTTAAIHSDGRIVIGGLFTSYNGIARSKIARLNTDGSLDTTFDPGTGPSDTVLSVAIQGDGKVLIGGLFAFYSGTARNKIARIWSN
jgi:uncharacterized delta-60 repeat protein